MIEESLKSTWTQINFFIHNLAQLKFSGHSEGALLSFIPKTFSMDMDGKIKNIEIFGYQKRYNPEKFYVGFCIDSNVDSMKIQIMNISTFIPFYFRNFVILNFLNLPDEIFRLVPYKVIFNLLVFT